jgi:thiol:disulfide interchange protein
MPAGDPRSGATRAIPRLLVIIAAALFIARIATGIREERTPPPLIELHWRPITGAEAAARTTRRPILYDFSAEWCVPCQRMAREVFADRRSAHAIESMFVPVRVLDRTHEEGRNPLDVAALQSKYGIEAFPTLVVVDAEGGNPVVIEGYPGREALMQRLVQAGMSSRMPPGLPPGLFGTDTTRAH